MYHLLAPVTDRQLERLPVDILELDIRIFFLIYYTSFVSFLAAPS